jgi:aspartyl-tRNA(Asn)/glutamyl-tRNA(Gln) amidotransferase subunit A
MVEASIEPIRAQLLAEAHRRFGGERAEALRPDLYRAHAAEYRPGIRAALERGCASRPRSTSGRSEPASGPAGAATTPRALRRAPDAAAGPAPDRATTGDPSFNAPWSGIGAPQIALPTRLAAGRLPLGIQLIGAPLAEPRLLAAARWVEAAIGFDAAPREWQEAEVAGPEGNRRTP